MNIVCISDTHQLEREVLVPAGDMLVHAGDFTMMRMATAETLRSFNSWLGEQPHRHKVLTCGNHEFEFERDPLLRDQVTNGQLLVNSGIELEGSPDLGQSSYSAGGRSVRNRRSQRARASLGPGTPRNASAAGPRTSFRDT